MSPPGNGKAASAKAAPQDQRHTRDSKQNPASRQAYEDRRNWTACFLKPQTDQHEACYTGATVVEGLPDGTKVWIKRLPEAGPQRQSLPQRQPETLGAKPEVRPALPAFLVDVLDSCPSAGNGVNQWLYTTARQLHAHMDEIMFTLLQEKTQNCGRAVQDTEIARQITCSRQTAWTPKFADRFPHANDLPTDIKTGPATPKWPEPNIEEIRRIVSHPYRSDHLLAASPIKLTRDLPSRTEEIIDAVFPGNPLLCCGLEMYKFATRRRETLRGNLSRCALIVPNPMLCVKGKTKEGKISEHCMDATAARIYQVVEFDFSEFAPDGVTETIWTPLVREWKAQGITVVDAAAALHLHLSVARDLVLVTQAGKACMDGMPAGV